LYYLKSRYYDTETGRFITIDGIEYLDPETINGLNLYAYCNNNPVSNVDANGNKWWHWLISGLQIVAGIVLVATGVGAGLGASLIVGGSLGIAGNIVGSQIAGGLEPARMLLRGILRLITGGFLGGNLKKPPKKSKNFTIKNIRITKINLAFFLKNIKILFPKI